MEIVAYQPCYKQDFIALNTAWVEKFFVMEQADRDILEHVDEWLDKGAMIYFAVEENQVLATCMAQPLGHAVWEICKLAANEQNQGRGAGKAVFRAAMQYAIRQGAEKLTLISNRILKPALHIYEKFGFQEVPLEKAYWGYDRADIQFEYLVPAKADAKE